MYQIGQLCSNKFQNLVRRVVFWSESGKAFIFSKYKKWYGIFQVLCSWCHAHRGLWGAEHLTFLIFSRPLFGLSCPQGLVGSWKLDFLNFQALCSGCRARRGLLGAGNLFFVNLLTLKIVFLTDLYVFPAILYLLEALRGIRTIRIQGGDPAGGWGSSKWEDKRKGEEVLTRLMTPRGRWISS